jgi:hypothetical protein
MSGRLKKHSANEDNIPAITRAAIERFGGFDTWVNDAGSGTRMGAREWSLYNQTLLGLLKLGLAVGAGMTLLALLNSRPFQETRQSDEPTVPLRQSEQAFVTDHPETVLG